MSAKKWDLESGSKSFFVFEEFSIKKKLESLYADFELHIIIVLLHIPCYQLVLTLYFTMCVWPFYDIAK